MITAIVATLFLAAVCAYWRVQARAQSRHRRAALARVCELQGPDNAYHYGRARKWPEVEELRPLLADVAPRSAEIDEDYDNLTGGHQWNQ